MCMYHVHKYIYFTNVCVHATYIYVYLCTCTYMYIRVHEFMNIYIHVCIMFRHIYTVLQYPVYVGRIPDAGNKCCYLAIVVATA
jgi:hypothetical protein